MNKNQITVNPEFFHINKYGKVFIFSGKDQDEELICLEESGPILWEELIQSRDLEEFFKRAEAQFQSPLSAEDKRAIDDFIEELVRLKIIKLT